MMALRLPRAHWEGRVEVRAGGFEGCVLWLGSGAAHTHVPATARPCVASR
jgi:hypothetical protein